MKKTILGAIAIASTASFACTTTPDHAPTAESAKPPAAAAQSWRAKLSLAQRVQPSVIAAVGGKHDPAGGYHVLSGGGGACGVTSGDATCDACLGASCCTEDAACAADADCAALVACGDACADDACFRGCFTSHPSGAAKLDAIGSCAEGSCSTACGAPPPPSGGGGSGGGSCGFASGDASCDACLSASCCGDANACLADSDCTALLDCEEACTDPACASACETAHPSGAAKLDALSACATTTCGAACSGAGSGSGSGSGGGASGGSTCGLTSGDATCDACLDGSCCAQTTACVGSADCVSVVQCEGACGDSACAAACESANPAGAASLNAVLGCVQTSCATACGP